MLNTVRPSNVNQSLVTHKSVTTYGIYTSAPVFCSAIQLMTKEARRGRKSFAEMTGQKGFQL